MKQYLHSTKVIVIAAIILLVGGVGTALAYQWQSDSAPKEPSVLTQTHDEENLRNNINLSPPTREEKSAGDSHKEEIVRQAEQNNQKPANAQVVIVDARQYASENIIEVRAFVSNIIESGGVCTITLTQGSQVVSEQSQAFADAQTTQCSTVTIPRNKFLAKGSWEAEIKYSSNSITGSAKKTVSIE